MDFTTGINRSEFKDPKEGIHTHTQRFYVEVVMLDQNPNGSKPVLYQLNSDNLTSFEDLDFLRQEFISLPHPAFTLLGEILEINMARKSIILEDGRGVTYKYLILVAGMDQKDEEGTVLHTLKDALMIDVLNVREIIQEPGMISSPFGKPAGSKIGHSFCVPAPHALHLRKHLEKIVSDKIHDASQSDPFSTLSPSQKKLCFLQM